MRANAGTPYVAPAQPVEGMVGAATPAVNDADPQLDDFFPDNAGVGVARMLEEVDLVNILCIPPDTAEGDLPVTVLDRAVAFCERRRT